MEGIQATPFVLSLTLYLLIKTPHMSIPAWEIHILVIIITYVRNFRLSSLNKTLNVRK